MARGSRACAIERRAGESQMPPFSDDSRQASEVALHRHARRTSAAEAGFYVGTEFTIRNSKVA